jgi:PAS domain-containing protein
MRKDKVGGAQGTAESKGKPADMTGFTVLQIIAWTNQTVIGCKELLETEDKGRILARLQGKIPGCKFALEALKEQFLLNDDFMKNSEVCVYANLSFEQLLGAMKDIELLGIQEGWIQFLSRIEEMEAQMKEYLLHKAKDSRELFVRQGRYEGMTLYKEVFEQIKKALDYRKTMEPLFNQEAQDAEAQSQSDPGTALVPTAGTGIAVRDQDISDEGDDEDEDDPDIGEFPV